MVDPKTIFLTFVDTREDNDKTPVTVSLNQILNELGFEYGFSKDMDKVVCMASYNPKIKIEVI